MTANRLGCVALSVSLVVLGAGCASVPTRAEPPQDIVLKSPIDQVWPQAERLLRDKGWQVEFKDGYVMATSWRQDTEAQLVPGGTGETLMERLVVAGRPLVYGRSTVRFIHQRRVLRIVDIGNGSAANIHSHENRDYLAGHGMEWHQESHQFVGPEQPIRLARVPELEQELAERLQPRVAVAPSH